LAQADYPLQLISPYPPAGAGREGGCVKQLRIIAEPPSVLQLKMSLNEELVF